MIDSPYVVLLGHRQQAKKTLLAQNLQIITFQAPGEMPWKSGIVWQETLPCSWENFSVEVLKQWPHFLRLLSLAKEGKILGIWAVTERTLLPGAILAKALGVPGIEESTARHCHLKYELKNWAKLVSLPQTSFEWFSGAIGPQDMQRLKDQWGYPILLKVPHLSGHRGQRKIGSDHELLTFLSLPESDRKNLLAEKWIEGQELSVETFLINGQKVFQSTTQYTQKMSVNVTPAFLDLATWTSLSALNDQVLQHFAIKSGLVHAEYYLTSQGPLLGELTVRPPGGYIMDLMSMTYQLPAWELAWLCIPKTQKNSLEPLNLLSKLPVRAHGVCGALILHPGEGQIKEILGIDSIKDIKEVKKFHLKVKEGDWIGTRKGAGDDIGHILVQAKDHLSLLQVVKTIQSQLRFLFHGKPLIEPGLKATVP